MPRWLYPNCCRVSPVGSKANSAALRISGPETASPHSPPRLRHLAAATAMPADAPPLTEVFWPLRYQAGISNEHGGRYERCSHRTSVHEMPSPPMRRSALILRRYLEEVGRAAD